NAEDEEEEGDSGAADEIVVTDEGSKEIALLPNAPETLNEEVFNAQLVVLDDLRVRVTKELIRHILEIYRLFSEEGLKTQSSPENEGEEGSSTSAATTISTTRSDLHSHFQYILRNKTEARVHYAQAQTSDIRKLEPGEETSFSFTNP